MSHECPLCPEEFGSRSWLSRHFNAEHDTPLKEYERRTRSGECACPTCDISFESEHALSIHHGRSHELSLKEAQIIEEGDPSECPTCGEICNGERGVSSHHVQAHGESIAGVEVECEWCGDSFRRAKSHVEEQQHNFCSESCHGQFRSEYYVGERNHQYKGGMVELECDECGGDFEVKPVVAPDRRFCSDKCHGDWRRDNIAGENHPLWNGGVFPYGEGWNERKKRSVRIRDQARCQECGRTEPDHLEKFGRKHHVHHIQKARSFDDPEMRNSMENLVTLCCGKCHQKWERMSPLRPQTASD